jgi:hypothetical protein
MVRACYSPSIRLFEAAACATPIISDYWPGLDTLFTPGKEILVADEPEKAMHYLRELPESERVALGWWARARVLAEHTAGHRATELEAYKGDYIVYPTFRSTLSNRSQILHHPVLVAGMFDELGRGACRTRRAHHAG